MDLPSKNMYDTYKDEIWKDLGPLDPDWFEALTAQTFTDEGNVSDQEELCANQEESFKTPLAKTAVDSQLFSTPKVFRHSRVVSPEPDNDQSFTGEQEKETLPWTATQSPYLFRISKEGVHGAKYGGFQHQGSFDLLHTPHKSPINCGKHISESLGAQLHPDMSWTSSLNTPPAVPSTLILSKTDESPCPVSVSAEKNVVFVRTLFPSLSNASRVGAMSPKNNDITTVQQGVVSPEAGQSPESPDHNGDVWKQTLPDVIEDGEIRRTVASVLDGAENVLSIFFANSSSALRKVKTDRVRRKQMIPTKEHGYSSVDTDSSSTINAASSEQRTTDQGPDIGITQWSPLSLSEIPLSTADASCHDKSQVTQVEITLPTEQLQSGSGQLIRPHMKLTDSGFIKKKRKFIYTVETSKSQVQGNQSSPAIPHSGHEVNVEQLQKAPDEAHCCSIEKNKIHKQGNLTEENPPPSVQAKVQDFDMSQLCKDFAQDFSQMSEPFKPSAIAVDAPPNGFSPSACLSAMRRAKQKANLHHDWDSVRKQRLVSTSNQNNPTNEGAVNDSGFQSAVSASSFILPSSEISGERWPGFKTDSLRTPFTCTNKEKTRLNGILQEAETDAKPSNAIKESQTASPGRDSELDMESTSAQQPSSAKGTVDSINCLPLDGQAHGSLPENTVNLPSGHASGFKTASNKGIHVSSANLERGKRLFEDMEVGQTLHEKPPKGAQDGRSTSHRSADQPLSLSDTSVDISCQLTASQKADVTELCTLLEEADSQFEFTQFETSKLKQHCQYNTTSPQKVDKELDPDFLSGIDFDDSFSFDAEKHLAVTVNYDKMTLISDTRTNCETSDVTSKSTGLSLSAAKEENVSSSSKHISEGSSSVLSADRVGCTETSKHPVTSAVGFKTAGGNVLRVSKKCLSKGRALFADLEENLVTSQKSVGQRSNESDEDDSKFTGYGKIQGSNVKESLTDVRDEDATKSKIDTTTCQNGFHMASGKGIHISAKALQKAGAFFKDYDAMDSDNGMSVEHQTSMEALPGSVSQKETPSKCDNVQMMKANFSVEPINEFENVTTGPAEHHTEAHNHRFKSTDFFHGKPSSTTKALSSLSCTTSNNFGSSDISELSSIGFHTASGNTVSVSADALKKAECLFNEIHTLDDTNQLKQKGDAVRPGHLTTQSHVSPPKNGGFQTASGKGVTVSSAALKKAKLLLSECDDIEDKTSVKPTLSMKPVPAPAPRSRGFVAASGKQVAFSAEALHKAKALFNDISFSADIPAVSDKKHDHAENMEEIHCGFTTAGGAKVHISHKNLLKAKQLLEDCDGGSISAKAMQETDDFFKGMSEKCENNIMSVSGSDNKNFSNFKHDPKETANICEEPGSGHSEFENVGLGGNQEKNTLHSANTASSHGDPSVTTKPLSPPSTTSNNCSSITDLRKHGGFCTARGKKVSVSDDAMTKAKSLLNESASFESTNKQLKQKEDTYPPHSGGFQTASGKGVVISSAALKKAKTLFNGCNEVEDKTSVKPTLSMKPVPAPAPRSRGFVAASGKQVAFSAEALHKAKALFSDISFSADIPAVSHMRITDEKQEDKTHCGFTTAGGAKVHVSQKSLLKAQNLLTELGDEACHYSSPHDVHQFDPSRVTTDSDKDMPEKFITPQVVTSLTSNYENQTSQYQKSVAGCPGEEMSRVLEDEINQTSSSEGFKVKRPEESSAVNFQSLNLSGCTETQQKFFAQEALDCTKALLEDESVAGLSMTENVLLQESIKYSFRSVEEHKGGGKRPAEETNMTGQPPLKRRLLEEFDRAIDSPRGSALHPEKSSPNGVMKDRRIFKYSVSLHPNITTPHRNGKNYLETRLQKTPTQCSTSVDSTSTRSKTPGFVPPFFKNTKTDKNALLKDNIRTPSAFVPPFKKQRAIVHQSSSRPQEEEEEKRHDLCMTPVNSTYVPPAKKTQSTTDVTGDKSTEDIQMVATADTKNDNQMNNHCGSEDSSAETSHMADTSKSQDMFQDLHNIELARDMQDMRIRKKKRQTVRPLPGSLFLTKSSGVSRIPLKAAVNGKPPARYTQKQLYRHGVHQHVCQITSETAESFRFSLQQFIRQEAFLDGGGVQLADGGWLIPSKDGTAGKEEFHRALCDTPGVDPKLISESWVYNHYRWIVWKQASMERSFPEMVGGLCLTPEQILLQLKYRYDVEVDHSRRPALRKIMEKDDAAAKTLVLCVCGVVSKGHSPNRQCLSDTKTPHSADAKVENPSAVVWLTDGWYAIKAQLDEPLTAMLHKGRVAVGVKLIIHGAQLVGSPEACSPLEAPESLMLKICANSSRPTRWDAKLGFHKDPRPFLLPVSSLYSSGGPVGCVDIIILRSYPIQWMERKPDGGVVFRSVRAEEKEARRYNSHKQKAMEILFAKIQAEFEQEDKRDKKPQGRKWTISHQSIEKLQDGEELYDTVGDDAAYLETHLSEKQLETLSAYRRSLMEKKQAELQDRFRRALENAEDSEGSCPKRDVTPVWRLCIADSMEKPGSVYQLSLWRPPSDLQSLLKEGCRYKVYNLTTSDGKKHSGSTTVQLTGTKKTQFQDLQATQEWISTRFQSRVSTHFEELQNPEFQSLCGEVDLTGYVISVIDGQGFSPAFYLTDGKLNFVKVRCFSSFAQSGLEDLVKPRVLLALSNLQLRGQSMSPTPVVYAGDLSVFSTNPKEVHLQEAVSQLRTVVQGQEKFFPTAEETLSHLVKSDGMRSISSPALQIRTPAFTPVRRDDAKTSVTSQQPIRSLGSFTPVGRIPPVANCWTEKEPSSLKRKRALDYLSRIPSPPPLSNLSTVASPCVNMTFNPPRRRGPPSTLKPAQTPARKPVSSPVEDEWVNDEELAMIDTQALHAGDLL